jgi:hypothetical protein
MAVVQKPISTSILAEKSGSPAWKQLPTWYQVSENDRIIPSAVEKMFAKQMNVTTISLPSSHAFTCITPKRDCPINPKCNKRNRQVA